MPNEEVHLLSEAEIKEYSITIAFPETGEVKHVMDRKVMGTLKCIKVIPELPQILNIKVYDEDNFLIFEKPDLTMPGLFYVRVIPPPYEKRPPGPDEKMVISGEGEYYLNDALTILLKGTPDKRVEIKIRWE